VWTWPYGELTVFGVYLRQVMVLWFVGWLCRISEEGVWHRQRSAADYHACGCHLLHLWATQDLSVWHMAVCIPDLLGCHIAWDSRIVGFASIYRNPLFKQNPRATYWNSRWDWSRNPIVHMKSVLKIEIRNRNIETWGKIHFDIKHGLCIWATDFDFNLILRCVSVFHYFYGGFQCFVWISYG